MNEIELSRRRWLQALAALGVTAPLGPAAFAQIAGGGAVVLYSTLNAQSVDAAKDVAKKALPNVRVDVVTGGSLPLLKRMETEAAKPQADIFWTSSANVMANYRNLFEPYKSPEAASVPPAMQDAQNHWVGANTHVVVAMINLRRLGADAPKTWADLTDARFKGKIIVADPGNSSTAFTALWGAEQVLGADRLQKLAANCTVSTAAANVVRSVGQGEYAVGITFESTAYPYVAGGQREIKLVYPQDGTFTVEDNMALVKGAPNMAMAKKMYDLLLSKSMQIALLESAFRRPSRRDIDVAKHVDMPPISQIKVVALDDAKAAAGRDAFLGRWRAGVAATRS
jgi:iron(III) transport system substrate-binding protein